MSKGTNIYSKALSGLSTLNLQLWLEANIDYKKFKIIYYNILVISLYTSNGSISIALSVLCSYDIIALKLTQN